MKIFITGATGFIGCSLALKLAEDGHEVNALYNSDSKQNFLQHKNIRLFKGSLLDKESIETAIEDCSQVYHLAGFARAWTKHPSLVYNLNVLGTLHLLEAAEKAGTKRILITSTAGVLGNSQDSPLDENSYPSERFTDYENSKFIMEEMIRNYRGNIHIVMVNPTRVFGPGQMSVSNSVTRMISAYIRGKWHMVPGKGNSIGNYVFINDLIRGMILAMEKGRHLERYILGGENISYNDLFNRIKTISGRSSWLVHIPVSVMLFISRVMMFFANNFGISPLLTPEHVKKFNLNFRLDNGKALKELGYDPKSLDSGLEETINWIDENENK